MTPLANDTIVRVGFFLYDGAADDQPGTWFRVDLTVAGDPDRWSVGGGYFPTQEQAERHLKETFTHVYWED